jgi:hypothetical protein
VEEAGPPIRIVRIIIMFTLYIWFFF